MYLNVDKCVHIRFCEYILVLRYLRIYSRAHVAIHIQEISKLPESSIAERRSEWGPKKDVNLYMNDRRQ